MPDRMPKAVVFDWDGTLVNSWPIIHESMNRTLEAMGHPVWTMEETTTRVRKSLREAFPELFGDRWEDARDIFYGAYREVHLERVERIDGADEMLALLQAHGSHLGVVSNKTGRFLRKEATHLKWDRFFLELIGAGDASRDKPSSEPIELFLKNNGLKKNSLIWYIGDADIDMETARNSGCLAVLLHADSLESVNLGEFLPEITLSGCEELAALVETL